MISLTKSDVAALAAYHEAVKAVAFAFYGTTEITHPGRMQPCPHAKQDITQGRPFRTAAQGFDFATAGERFCGQADAIATQMTRLGYEASLFLKQGSSAKSHLVRHASSPQGDGCWHVVRGRTKPSMTDGMRDDNPVVLQPLHKISLADAPALEIMPVLPVVDFVPGGVNPVLPLAPRTQDVLTTVFRQAGLSFGLMTDMGVLPEGQVLFVDSGHCRRRDDTLSDEQMQNGFDMIRYQLTEVPDLHAVFAYVDADGQRVQDACFKPSPLRAA